MLSNFKPTVPVDGIDSDYAPIFSDHKRLNSHLKMRQLKQLTQWFFQRNPLLIKSSHV